MANLCTIDISTTWHIMIRLIYCVMCLLWISSIHNKLCITAKLKMAINTLSALIFFCLAGLPGGHGQAPNHPKISESSTAYVCICNPTSSENLMWLNLNLLCRLQSFLKLPQILKSILLAISWKQQILGCSDVSVLIVGHFTMCPSVPTKI